MPHRQRGRNFNWMREVPKRLISSIQVEFEGMCFWPLHVLLQKNWIPPFVISLMIFFQNLQASAVLFDPEFAGGWNSTEISSITQQLGSLYLDRQFEGLPAETVGLASYAGLVLFLGLSVMLLVHSRTRIEISILLAWLRAFLEATRTIFVFPFFQVWAKNFSFLFWPEDVEKTPSLTSPILIKLNSIISGFGFVFSFWFVCLLQMSFIDVKISNESAFAQNPHSHQTVLVFFLALVSVLRIFIKRALVKYLILVSYAVFSIYVLKFIFIKPVYFCKTTRVIYFFFAAFNLWTVFMTLMNVVWTDGFSSVIWLSGLPLILGLSLIEKQAVLKLETEAHSLSLEKFLHFEGTALQIFFRSGSDSEAFQTLQGYLAHHHVDCKDLACPLGVNKQFEGSPLGLEHNSKVRRAFLGFINYLYERQINENYMVINLRVRYCLFLVNFWDRKDYATSELSLISQLEPRIQVRFFIFSLWHDAVDSKNSPKSAENILISNEIQKYWILRDCLSFVEEIERLCKSYIEFWVNVCSINFNQDELYRSSLNFCREIEKFEIFWDNLHPMSSNKNPKSLITLGLFMSSVGNQLDRGRKLIDKGMKQLKESASKGQDLELLMLDTNLNELDVPSIVISGNPSSPGIITEFNTNALVLFGYQKEEVIGENLNILMQKEIAVLHDDYLRKSVAEKSANKFATERIVYGRSKSNYLIAIRVVVKAFFQKETFFIGKIIGVNKTMWISDVMTDSSGRLKMFSEAAIKMLGLSLRDCERETPIDTLLPQFSLFAEYERNQAQNQTVTLTSGTFNINVQSFIYENMKEGMIVFNISKKVNDSEEETKEKKFPLPQFEFAFDLKSNFVPRDTRVSQRVTYAQLELGVRAGNREDYAENITNAKLSLGKIIKYNTNSLKDFDLVGEASESNDHTQGGDDFWRKGTQNELDQSRKIEIKEESYEFWVRRHLRDLPLPVSMILFLSIIGLLSAAFCCGLGVNSFLSRQKLDQMSSFVVLSKHFFEVRSTMLDMVSQIFNNEGLTHFQQNSIVAEYETTRKKLTEQMESGLQVLFDNSNDYNPLLKELFGVELFSFSGYSNSKPLNYIEAIKALSVDAFITMNTSPELYDAHTFVQNRFISNVMNEFWNKLEGLQQRFFDFQYDHINDKLYFWLIVSCLLILVTGESLYFFMSISSMKRRISNELVLLMEIDYDKAKQKIKTVQNFLMSMEIESNMEFMEVEDDNREKDIMFANKKRAFLQISPEHFHVLFVTGRFLFVGSVLAFIVVSNYNRIYSTNILVNEVITAGSFKGSYHYTLNAFYCYAFLPEMTLNHSEPASFLMKLVLDLPNLDEDLTTNQMIAMALHSDEYTQFSQKLLLENNCDLLAESASVIELISSLSTCYDYLSSRDENDYVSEGLTVGLTKYSQNMFSSISDFFADENAGFPNTENCTLAEKRLCFLENKNTNINFIYTANLLKDFSRLLSKHLIEDFQKIIGEGSRDKDSLFLLLLISSLVLWLGGVALISALIYLKMKNVRKLLLLIPTEFISFSPKLRDFFNIDGYFASYDSPSSSRK